MLTTNSTQPTLIAPCGINCRLCRAYTRDKKPCPGCRHDSIWKPNACANCQIKNCQNLAAGGKKYCFSCDEFPCARVARLDKRYRTKYGTSPIDNLQSIKAGGIRKFVESENEKWTCPECGEMLCMHKPQCLSCGYVWQR